MQLLECDQLAIRKGLHSSSNLNLDLAEDSGRQLDGRLHLIHIGSLQWAHHRRPHQLKHQFQEQSLRGVEHLQADPAENYLAGRQL